MKYRKIKIVKAISVVHLLKWLRHNNQDMSLQNAIDWIKSLPKDTEALDEPKFEKLENELKNIAEFTSEIIGDTLYDSVTYSHDGYVFTSRYNPELKDAEQWRDNLNEVDKARVMILCRHNYPVG